MKTRSHFNFILSGLPIIMLILLLSKALAAPTVHLQQVFADTTHKEAPYFLLVNSEGRTINTAEQSGKVLFINFWATSCIPCMEEMPSINQLYNYCLNDTNILVLSIDVDDDFVNSMGYMSKHNFSLPVYHTNSSVPENYFRGILPTTVLIDKKGRITRYYEGEMDYSNKEFIGLVDSLIRNY